MTQRVERNYLEITSVKDLKDELKKQRSKFTSFPFLFEEITKKIKDINYKSSLQECY